MASQLVTLHVPDTLFSHIQKRAEQTNCSVEAEVLDVLATAVPASEQLPTDLAEAVSPLTLLDDECLWRAARREKQRGQVSFSVNFPLLSPACQRS